MVGNFPWCLLENAMKLLKGEGKARNFNDIFNTGWKPVSWDRVYPENHYEYDEKGRLMEERNIYLFTWK